MPWPEGLVPQIVSAAPATSTAGTVTHQAKETCACI